jgi:23S rRNA-/tRNA-specific pseudouridylate synthase
MEKAYLAVVQDAPKQSEWTCRLRLAPDANAAGRMRADARHGKQAETQFRVLLGKGQTSLVEARPVTGRTHQIRVHLAESGHPVVGDRLYGPQAATDEAELGLRAVRLAYVDPLTRQHVEIRAPSEEFVRRYGFDLTRP